MDFDLIVIGAGSGGVRAARMAAALGKKVAIVEHQALGGTCVNVGCVPKKLLFYAADFAHQFKDAQGFGWNINKAQFNWQQLIQNKNKEIARLNGIYGNLLAAAGVHFIQGKARVTGAHTVEVAGKSYQADKLLIATGSSAFIPDIEGKEWADTSDAMFFLEQLPNKILIVGGGYIAVEFAGIFNALGVKTHLIYRGELFLQGFDQDLRKRLYKEMQQKGVHVQFQKNIRSIKKQTQDLLCQFEDGTTENFDRVLFATGRVPNTHELGLDAAGITLGKRGAIEVNTFFQTHVASIYALGDVIARVPLTPVAIEEAMVCVDQLYGSQQKHMDYSNIPSAVFSQPNIASVGLSEAQAVALSLEEGFEVQVFESDFRALKYTLTDNPERSYMKLIVNKRTQKVLGVHMLGDNAAEIIQGFAVAVKMGASKQDFDNTLGIHPSSAEEFVTMRSARS